jgi:hypothetical protein
LAVLCDAKSITEGKERAAVGARAALPGALALATGPSVELLSVRLRKPTLAVERSAYAPTDDRGRPDHR